MSARRPLQLPRSTLSSWCRPIAACSRSRSSLSCAVLSFKGSVMSLPLRQTLHSSLRSSVHASRSIHASTSKLQSKPTERKATDPPAGKETANDKPLGPLSRPLGVRQRPSTEVKSRKDRIKELLDGETRMAQRRHLCVSSSHATYAGIDDELNVQDQRG